MANSMNKAFQGFEAHGNSGFVTQGYLCEKVTRKQWCLGEGEVTNENMCRIIIHIERFGTPGCSNIRSRREKNPKGYRIGNRYDRGIADNAFAWNRGICLTGDSRKIRPQAVFNSNYYYCCFLVGKFTGRHSRTGFGDDRGRKSAIDGSLIYTYLLTEYQWWWLCTARAGS